MRMGGRSIIAVIAAATLALGGCAAGGGGADGGSGDATDPVTIRFGWWGSDERAETTKAVIAAFEEANPDIVVEPETSDFTSYFDRLATNTAANDSPDVITLGGAYPREYSDRGALLDLAEVGDALDTSKFNDDTLTAARFDGTLYGVPTGGNAIGVVINRAVFAEAGVPVPDTTAWTWDDFVQAAEKVSAATADGTFGFEPRINDTIGVYAAQRGTPIFTEDGELGVKASTLEDYWDMELDLVKGGGSPSAEQIVELSTASPEQTLMGQGKAAMTIAYSNLLATYEASSGADLDLVALPGETEFEQPGATVLPSQFYSISSQSEHPEEAARLIDYLVNSTDAGELILDDRGLPFNTEVLDAVKPLLAPASVEAAEYLETVAESGAGAVPIAPAGGSALNEITSSAESDVLFGKSTPADAAKKWHSDLQAALESVS